jgi:ferredoxin
MAMWINEECISCSACEPECPNEAITQGDSIYVIDADKCTECVGAFDAPKCVEICPVEDCIVTDPHHTESREELEAKYQRLH